MSVETNSQTPQIESKRYCPACDTQVTQDAEMCPSCKKILFVPRRPSWQAELIGFLWGGLQCLIAMAIWGGIKFIIGLSESYTLSTFEKIVGVSIWYLAWQAKKAQLKAPRDIAVWKSDSSSESNVL